MVRFTKFNRLAAAALLTVSAVAFSGGVSGAQPAPTGSLTDNGNGTATMTFDDETASALSFLVFNPSGTPCPTPLSGPVTLSDVLEGADYIRTNQGQGGSETLTIQPGLEVLTSSEAPDVLPAGEYELCLYWGTGGSPVVQFLDGLGDPPLHRLTASPHRQTHKYPVAGATGVVVLGVSGCPGHSHVPQR
jgi:hypothetical protein